MTRLKNLMSEYKLLKIKVRLEQNEEKRSRLVASLLSIRGQFKEHNLMLIKKRMFNFSLSFAASFFDISPSRLSFRISYQEKKIL